MISIWMHHRNMAKSCPSSDMTVALACAGAISGTMTRAVANKAFPAPEHDHDLCLEEAMERARAAFQSKGLKLTPLRQSVFREIAASHKAIGAYEVLDRLASRGDRLAPISVYRAIEALVTAGIVHRFESRNAFFACHTGHQMRQLVLACEGCGRVAEADADAVFAAIDSCTERAGFAAKGAVVEVWGVCASCAGDAEEPVHASA
jgi:Fur family zinc uptake transcriptional regulator